LTTAIDKALALQVRVKAKKQAQWLRLQAETPEIAAVLTAVHRVFGKPAAVRVTLASGEVLVQTGAVDFDAKETQAAMAPGNAQ
jgi:hypothetical protein